MYVFHVQKFLVESWRAATVLSIFPGLKALWLSACEPASLLAFTHKKGQKRAILASHCVFLLQIYDFL